MPRPVRPWFRMYTEIFPDRKIRRLTPAQRWLFSAMMGAARESPVIGSLYVAEDMPMTYGELASYADVKEREVAPAVALMIQLKMVHLEDGVMVVTNFPSRQYESDVSTERTRKHRSNHEDGNDVGTAKPSSQERVRNVPETETETETELTALPRKRGRRLPDDWQPTAADIAWQRQQPITDAQAKRQTEKFKDHWRAASGQSSVKLDWSAAWKNWIRTEIDRMPLPAGSPKAVNNGW